jgi:hypothetical protein
MLSPATITPIQRPQQCPSQIISPQKITFFFVWQEIQFAKMFSPHLRGSHDTETLDGGFVHQEVPQFR